MSIGDLSDEAWIAILAVIGWTILQSLKAMCVHLDHEIKLHNLTIDARRMREGYMTRLHGEAAAAKSGRRPGPVPARKINEFVAEVEIVEPGDAEPVKSAA